MPPRPLRAAVADPVSRPLIRFDARARLLSAALARSSSVSNVSAGMLDLQVRIDGLQGPNVAVTRREVRRLVDNGARSIVDAVKQLNRRIGYDTGLMASSWREDVSMSSDDTFKIEITNPAPYAAVARRAGADWHAGRTMLEYHIRPLVRRLTGQLATSLRQTIASMVRRRQARAS